MSDQLSRREVLGGMAGLTALAVAAPTLAAGAPLPKDGHFLSAQNPIANVDQRDVERTALELLKRPEVMQAREKAGFLWKQVTQFTAGAQMSRFDQMMDEYTYNYALKAANGDGNFPKVTRVYSAPIEWLGHKVPGSRWGGDNPDNAYRIIPILRGGRYEIHGTRMPGGISNVTYTLVGNTCTSITLGSLEDRDVKTNFDGTFVITIDERPAQGQSNHIQNQPGAMYLFIRDSMSDWGRETPNALRVRKLDAPTRQPLTLEEMAQHAARHIVEDVYLVYWFTRLNYGFPPNRMMPPRASGSLGGLRSQMGSQGLIQLQDDEAMVITTTSGNAAFRDFVLHDVWYLTIEYWKRQSSLNPAQMAADADGRFTMVVAHQDPGVHNWVDTGGLGELYALHRWQGLPRDPAAPTPEMNSRVVKLKDLELAFPRGVKTITATERAQQLARRQQEFKRRFVDT